MSLTITRSSEKSLGVVLVLLATPQCRLDLPCGHRFNLFFPENISSFYSFFFSCSLFFPLQILLSFACDAQYCENGKPRVGVLS